MQKPTAAAIYARISSDPTGTRAGVDRQLADCHAVAEKQGWTVAAEYVDNDISAFNGAPRPRYAQMLTDLENGTVDAVIVWHIDRLTRRPIELEQFLAVVDRARVRHVKFVTGDADIASGDGLLMARIMAAVAAKESADKSRRLRRKMDELAAKGMPTGGGTRPFGYTPDRLNIVPEEAATIRDLVTRFLAGESLRSLALWLNANGARTVTGKPWSTTTLRGMLGSPRIAGLYEHRGHVVGTASWPAIITEDQHRRVLAQYAAKKNSGRRTPQRYLLSGMLRCGKCENRLYSSLRKTTRRYVCASGPDHRGCGRLTVVADPVERLIADAVLYRLDTTDLTDALSGKTGADETARTLSAAVEETQEQLDDLAAAHGAGKIPMREWLIARRPIEQRRDAAQRQLASRTRTDALAGLIGNGEQLRPTWASLNLSRQHAIVAALVDHITIGPGTPGARTLDPGRVTVTWRH